jgi:RimJ/RimL family protein N-acetyltransferase
MGRHDGRDEPAPTFRRMELADLRLLHEWLQRPHIQRWWDEHETYASVVEQYAPAIRGDRATDLYLALLDGRPIGFLQTYLVADHPDFAALIEAGDHVAGVDLFVADETMTGKGLGTELLRRFVDEVVFAHHPAAIGCIADPDVRNTASLRAFEKAGFREVRQYLDPGDGQVHALLRLDRAGPRVASPCLSP